MMVMHLLARLATAASTQQQHLLARLATAASTQQQHLLARLATAASTLHWRVTNSHAIFVCG
jgi:hypothetical protein